MIQSTDKQKQEARKIRLPFPCGCLDAHSGGGMTVKEFTCEAHSAIASALSSRDTEIREVLEGLAVRRNIDHKSLCWCEERWDTAKPHSNACLATQRLWERVQAANSHSP